MCGPATWIEFISVWASHMDRVYICVGQPHGYSLYMCGPATLIEFIYVWASHMDRVYICVGQPH